jgi:hypothetical protein
MNKDEEKSIEYFIKQAVYTVINSRVCFEKSEISTGNLSKKSENKGLQVPELEEIFEDEYSSLSGSNKNQEKFFVLDIFFKRKEIKLLIEKWKFKYTNE